jgi:hypothetical protein
VRYLEVGKFIASTTGHRVNVVDVHVLDGDITAA